MKYRIQNRYQDGGWEFTGDEFDSVEDAIDFAIECACDSIAYGMVRVIRGLDVIETYGAGEGKRIKANRRREFPRLLMNVPWTDPRGQGRPRDTNGDGDCPQHPSGAANAMVYATQSIRVTIDEWPPAWTKWNKKPPQPRTLEVLATLSGLAREKATRIEYQDLVYQAMNLIDAKLGTKGGCTTDTFIDRLKRALQ